MIRIIAPISFMFMGIAIIIASLIISWQNEANAELGKAIYTDNISAMNVSVLEEKTDLYSAYNWELLPGQYEQIDEIIGYIEIPAIDIRYPILKGETEENLSKGIAHVSGTSLPMGENGTVSVLMGHNGEYGNVLFTHLDELTEYDEILITILDKTYLYEVVETSVVAPEDVTWNTDDNKANLTLITCTPYGVNTHRLLVNCQFRKELTR